MKFSDNEITFCDNHLIVAIKPAGLLTQPTEKEKGSLETALKAFIKGKYNKPGAVFLHAVHRLDRPVSGLVLFARTSKALSRLNESQRNMEIERRYIAEVEGALPDKEGRLDHYLIHGEHRALIGKKEEPGAKRARLYYERLELRERSTLVLIRLETGRYHQIRAQFSAICHPVVGDKRYGADLTFSDRIHLHSSELFFKHPVSKELLRFSSCPPFCSNG